MKKTGNIKQTPLYVFLVFLTVSSCRNTNTIEIGPLAGSSIGDSTLTLQIEEYYPSMTLVTEGAIHLQVKEEVSKDFTPKTHIRYLPLETTDECLIGYIDKIESDDANIFIFDNTNNQVLRFSQQDGRFLNRIGNYGRGPGEYIDLNEISINKAKKEIYLIDFQLYKLICFNYDGQLVREEPLFYCYNAIECLGEHLLLHTEFNKNEHAPSLRNNRLVLAKSDQTPLYVGFSFREGFDDKFHQSAKHNFLTCNGEVYYNHVLSDTIWQIKENGVCEAHYVFKFPGRDNLYDEKDFQGITDDEYERKKEGKPYYRDELAITKDFVKADINGAPTVLYCLSTGHCFNGSPNYRCFGTPTNRSAKYTLNDTSFVLPLQPFEIIKDMQWMKSMVSEAQYKHMLDTQLTEEERRLLSTMTEEDNPILMIMDIEPF
ncbi:MAG: 6-bladed beta-propeller [Clostridium sp.]|nr:6-bladed beta-propeller [Clostridium sp.]